MIQKKGSWISFSESLLQELKDAGFETIEKLQGEHKLLSYLESNPEITEFMYKDFQKLSDAL
jgi:hypothetical protein